MLRIEPWDIVRLHFDENERVILGADPHAAVEYLVKRDSAAPGRLHALGMGCRSERRCGTRGTRKGVRGISRCEVRAEVGARAGVEDEHLLDVSRRRQKRGAGCRRQIGRERCKICFP